MSPEADAPSRVSRNDGVSTAGKAGPRAERDDSFLLADYVQLVWRKRALILGGTLLCGLTALVFSLLSTPIFEARATLAVQPPLVAGKLRTPELSLEAYRVFLKSDFVVDQTRAELVKRDIIPPETPFEAVKKMFSVETYDAGRKTPLLDLVVKAHTGERAGASASVWAEVSLRHVSRLTRQMRQRSAQTVEAQFRAVRDSVAEEENRLSTCQREFDARILKLDTTWDRRLTELAKETKVLSHDHDLETARLRLAFETRWKPDLLRRRLAAQEASLLNLEKELLDARTRIKIRKATVAKLKLQLEAEPLFLVLTRAMSDQALWDRITDPEPGSLEKLDNLHLQSEVLNPAHQDLWRRLTQARLERDQLAREIEYMPGEIEHLRQEIDELRALVGEKSEELSSLLEDRKLALTNLLADREQELRSLKKRHEVEIAQLQRQRDEEVEALTRDAETARAAYATVAETNESSRLASLEEESEVRIWAPAIAPHRPLPSRMMLNVVTALVVGLILSILLAFLIEQVQPARVEDPVRAGGPAVHPEGGPGSGSSSRFPDDQVL